MAIISLRVLMTSCNDRICISLHSVLHRFGVCLPLYSLAVRVSGVQAGGLRITDGRQGICIVIITVDIIHCLVLFDTTRDLSMRSKLPHTTFSVNGVEFAAIQLLEGRLI